MSSFAAITAAVQTLLLQSPAPAGARVWRGRLKPLAQEHDTAIVVRPLQATGRRQTIGGSVQWQGIVAVDCYARAAAGQDPEAAIDALLDFAYGKVAAAGQIATGVVDTGADPVIEWDFGEGDTAFVCATLNLRVTVITQAATLAAWP